MLDFLTFHTFITPKILLIIYYMGALIVPLFGWYLLRYLKRRFFPDLIIPKKMYLYLAMLLCFLCAELFWRMIFEVMIAYFDMHDALMRMSR